MRINSRAVAEKRLPMLEQIAFYGGLSRCTPYICYKGDRETPYEKWKRLYSFFGEEFSYKKSDFKSRVYKFDRDKRCVIETYPDADESGKVKAVGVLMDFYKSKIAVVYLTWVGDSTYRICGMKRVYDKSKLAPFYDYGQAQPEEFKRLLFQWFNTIIDTQ